MFSSPVRFASLFLLFTSALSEFTPCPLLGPFYPPFKVDLNDKAIESSLKHLTAKFDDLMRTGDGENGPVNINTTSFSIAVFSTNEGTAEDEPFYWQYHYTAPDYRNGPDKPRNASKDSIYRIGGLTELFTVWSLLRTLGDGIFNDPVTKYLPELSNDSSTHTSILQTIWSDITVGQLASHMGGIPRDYCSDDLTSEADIFKAGLPIHSNFDRPCCSSNSKCSQKDFLHQLSKQAPIANPGQTPIYSNMAFQLLGYIIERRTGQSFKRVLKHQILDPLELNDTSVFAPLDTQNAVIPVNQKASGWLAHLPGTEASTSMFSSLDNLARVGQAIMKSTLLTTSQTNRWLKPATHTANPANSIGYPFVIYSGGDYPNTSPMVDVYTILSNEGYQESLYSSYMGLVPDWGVGYAILSADTESPADLNAHADYMQEALGGVLNSAVTQAAENYYGVYTSAGSSNSSLSIDYTERVGWGIYIDDFVSNGQDYRETLSKILGVSNETDLSIRLYPTRLSEEYKAGSKQSFRAVLQDMTELADNDTPTCVSWMHVDRYQYNGHGLDEFIFTLNAEGKVVSVEVPALEVTLEKQKEKEK
ncbi:Beta-lactamase-like protein [Penicillium cosmopolitanum]|uniref:Beta-lactamase-like protein n=1 Tax=Penicillium cosmopolitanum TaxID=1131564 RepID=A0A9X0B8C1_9EURO|nr:Beta-lactamase-like protein [Penicillium cosmopolitanum]KAJ5391882.1 Beta-lactamase-like protein [Penicillium cosmopolitanum]